MILEDRIIAFEKLGQYLMNFEKLEFEKELIQSAEDNNSWFTESSIRFSLLAVAKMLSSNNLRGWIQSYSIVNQQKQVGVIIPSNIPLVGFYDFLCILLSGNIFIGQLSSSNNIVLPYLANLLFNFNSDFKQYIFFKRSVINIDLDILIATGNDSSACYFNYSYSHLPKIVRKNRTSIAVLNGFETFQDYEKLSLDIYTYFGLGCRNVSQLFLPSGFDLDKLRYPFSQNQICLLSKNYTENYSYQKSILKINNVDFIDFGNLLLVESDTINASIAVLHYQYYNSIKDVEKYLNVYQNKIQCIVSQDSTIKNSISFGNAQTPTLYDFPDRIDVLQFILSN